MLFCNKLFTDLPNTMGRHQAGSEQIPEVKLFIFLFIHLTQTVGCLNPALINLAILSLHLYTSTHIMSVLIRNFS